MSIEFKVCMYRMRFQIIMTPLMMKNGQKAIFCLEWPKNGLLSDNELSLIQIHPGLAHT